MSAPPAYSRSRSGLLQRAESSAARSHRTGTPSAPIHRTPSKGAFTGRNRADFITLGRASTMPGLGSAITHPTAPRSLKVPEALSHKKEIVDKEVWPHRPAS